MPESDRRNSQDAAIQCAVENAESDHRIAELEAELSRIRASHAWQVAMKIQKMLAVPAHAAMFLGRDLKLCALQDLEPGARAGRRTEWTITGRDPQFAFSLAGAGGFPAAHYRLVVDAPAGGELLDAARIYVDEGSGFSEERTVYPKWRRTRGGTRLAANFTLPRGAASLRFDPCEEPGRVVLGRFRLRRLSRAEYYSGLALRLSRERAKRGQGVTRDQRRALDVVRAKGLGGLAAKLRALDPGASVRTTADIARKRGLRVVADNTGARFVAKRRSSPPQSLSARLICFYLPQFHPVPQNDEWWGEGFTEWTNVRPAVPQFEGHYQPHVPGELGYYDLRDQKVQRAQVDLAKLYGIGGFCFYFYWFGGERLLETPIESYLAQPDLDLPFCLCWANENWTRRWDGLEREILIAQDHSPEDDIAFIAHVAKYLRDPRYIRVDGKPLLLVYRPKLLPDAQETAARWRAWCRENGVGEIYLAYTQSFETVDPAHYGFDAAVEFPPNNSGPPDITEAVTPLRDDFSGKVFDWSVFVERSARMPDPGYALFRGACPSWDNTARRKNGGTVFVNNTPEGFRAWLRNAITDTQKRFAEPDKRLVFINAWNEWAEGAHLEPDQAYGYAWLDAARQAVEAKARRIVVVSHDAHPHGAQLLALNMAKGLGKLGFDVDLVSLGDGALLAEFAGVATVHRLDPDAGAGQEALDLLSRLRKNGAEIAIANTTVSGKLVPLLKRAGFTVVSLVHELPGILNAYGLKSVARAIAADADTVVFPAEVVRESFEGFVGKQVRRAVIRPQGLYMRARRGGNSREDARGMARGKLALDPEARVVLGVGYGDRRKGLDLFVSAGIEVLRQDARAVAVWVGHFDADLKGEIDRAIGAAGLEDRFRFAGLVDNPQDYYAAADVYVLSSREDPFPSTVLEAMDAGLPMVGFEGSGGAGDLLRRGCGILVPYGEAGALAEAVMGLLADEHRARELGLVGKGIVAGEFEFEHYLRDLLELAGHGLPGVSVVVPNYNYGRFIEARLASIAVQTLRPYELIVLDDASTDDSVERIERFLESCDIPSRLIVNDVNSGSVFRQWQKGTDLAKGDFLWIAEADDLADPDFLAETMAGFEDDDVVLSYTQSRQMADDGRILGEDYLDYVRDVSPTQWLSGYRRSGREEIAEGLSVKNTIPNVSAVVFRREALADTFRAHMDEIVQFRVAGDWCTYVRLLERGSCSYSSLCLNSHRRHGGSVTIQRFGLQELKEIERMQEIAARVSGSSNRQIRARVYSAQLRAQIRALGTEPEQAGSSI